MKLVIIAGVLATGMAQADHRMELDDSECHFVLPNGITNNNNGDETKESNCPNSLRTNGDGTRTGSVVMKRKYAPGTVPVTDYYTYDSEGTGGIVCNMTDGGTTYTTNDWKVTYKPKVEDLADFHKSFFTQEGDKNYERDFDYNEDGIIDYQDLTIFQEEATGKVKYTLACYNGVAQ